MERFCQTCKLKSIFLETDKKNRYKCTGCEKIFKKCGNKDCLNMISIGIRCADCTGNIIKNLRTGTITAGLGVAYMIGKKIIRK